MRPINIAMGWIVAVLLIAGMVGPQEELITHCGYAMLTVTVWALIYVAILKASPTTPPDGEGA